MPARSPGAVGSGGGRSTTFFIASIERLIEGFFSGADHTAAAIQPPGLSTRVISAAAFGTSGRNMRQNRLVTASNEFASNRRLVASPVRKATFVDASAVSLRH